MAAERLVAIEGPSSHWLPFATRLKRLPKASLVLDLLLGVGVFAVALAVYNATLAPSLSYRSSDSNELATVCYQLGLAHSPGYPLYTWLGKLFTFLPVGDVAHRVNLMSAVGAAGAATFLFGIVRLLTTSRIVALFGALFFAFSATLWSQAVISEVYAPNAFMMGLTLLLLLAWAHREERNHARARSDRGSFVLFSAFCLSYGLSLGTHLSNLVFAPGIAVFVLMVNRRILTSRATMASGATLAIVGGLQYLWLPLRASTLLDPVMLQRSPTSFGGFFEYTFNAFSESRFAYPVQAIPGRMLTYLDFVWDNLGPLGIGLSVVGLWVIFRHHTKVFVLLMLIYVGEVGYFVQYKAFDLGVFFIPAHFIEVLCAACGAYWLGQKAGGLFSSVGLNAAFMPSLQGTLLALLVVLQIRANWAVNDLSDDTSINDFYEQVFARVESDSVLIGERGVIGYDMFYFREVYDRRPDILMPLLDDPNAGSPLPEGVTIYSTFRPVEGAPRDQWDPPLELLPEGYGYVPLLTAPTAARGRLIGPQIIPDRPLVLYHVQQTPPLPFVDEASPQHPLSYRFGGIDFLGVDVRQYQVRRGESLHLTLYWRLRQPGHYLITTFLGKAPFRDVHGLGFGDFEQRGGQVQAATGAIVVEDYDLVVLSSTPPGRQTLRLQVASIDPVRGWNTGWQPIDLAEIRVIE